MAPSETQSKKRPIESNLSAKTLPLDVIVFFFFVFQIGFEKEHVMFLILPAKCEIEDMAVGA